MSYKGSYGGESSGYVTIGNYTSMDTQVGVEDTPKSITFGAGGTTSDGSLSVAADGEVSIILSGYYSIKQRFRAARSGQSGISSVFFWAELSTDNGVTWDTIGNSVDISLDTSNESSVFFDLANIYLQAGVKLRNRFARSSTGDDSGDLMPALPSGILTALGVPDAPSAQITLYKLAT